MLEKKDTQNETDQKAAEKNKKMEKPPSDPHREYLDMDTDEEEFGKPGRSTNSPTLNSKSTILAASIPQLLIYSLL